VSAAITVATAAGNQQRAISARCSNASRAPEDECAGYAHSECALREPVIGCKQRRRCAPDEEQRDQRVDNVDRDRSSSDYEYDREDDCNCVENELLRNEESI
jgi:hypothetical protein